MCVLEELEQAINAAPHTPRAAHPIQVIEQFLRDAVGAGSGHIHAMRARRVRHAARDRRLGCSRGSYTAKSRFL